MRSLCWSAPEPSPQHPKGGRINQKASQSATVQANHSGLPGLCSASWQARTSRLVCAAPLSKRNMLAAGAARLERAVRRAGARRPGAPPARGTGARSPGRARPRRSVPRAHSPAWCCPRPGWPWCWRHRSGAPARPGSGAAPRACLRRALLRRQALPRAARPPCATGAAYVAVPDTSRGAWLPSISSGASVLWSPVSRGFHPLRCGTHLDLQRPTCSERSAGASSQSGASSAESSPSKLLSPLDEHAQAALRPPASRASLLSSDGAGATMPGLLLWPLVHGTKSTENSTQDITVTAQP